MVKVRNNGSDYVGPHVEVRAGETVEVSEQAAAYLTSDDCPGKFSLVEPPAPARAADKKAGK